MENNPNIPNNWNDSFSDAFAYSRRDVRLDAFPFVSAMWPIAYMWLAYPILHVLPRTQEQCRKMWNIGGHSHMTSAKFRESRFPTLPIVLSHSHNLSISAIVCFWQTPLTASVICEYPLVTILKFFMASTGCALLLTNCLFRCDGDDPVDHTSPRSRSYQIMLAWYLHYLTNLIYHQVDIFVYTHTVCHATYRSAVGRGILKSFCPLYLWMHSRLAILEAV